jgi:hypothetical protein
MMMMHPSDTDHTKNMTMFPRSGQYLSSNLNFVSLSWNVQVTSSVSPRTLIE